MIELSSEFTYTKSQPLFSKHMKANTVKIRTDHNDFLSFFLKSYNRSAVSYQNITQRGTQARKQSTYSINSLIFKWKAMQEPIAIHVIRRVLPRLGIIDLDSS
jgi:hypothetical protein